MEDERFSPPTDDRRRAQDPWWGVHAARYTFAAELLAADGGAVLDVACGSGFGLGLLEPHVDTVVGVDLDLPSLAMARRMGVQGPLVGASAHGLPFPDGSFDVVTSFETIEHLDEREVFMAELARVLRRGGRLILSTPNAAVTMPGPDGPANPYHLHEYDPAELRRLVERHFGDVRLLGQVLDGRWRISPFQDEQQRLPGDRATRARLLAWRVANKLPRRAIDGACRALWRRPFVPRENDYRFADDVLGVASVMVVLARRR